MQEVILNIYSYKTVVGDYVYRQLVFVLREIELGCTKCFFLRNFFIGFY